MNDTDFAFGEFNFEVNYPLYSIAKMTWNLVDNIAGKQLMKSIVVEQIYNKRRVLETIFTHLKHVT